MDAGGSNIKAKRFLINDQIQVPNVRVIDADGSQLGILNTQDAISKALSQGLDLLLVSDVSNPPVCKIIDYGQFRYQQQKKDKVAKKASKAHTIKEIKMSPKISIHDYDTRVKHAIKFLEKGHKVKLTIPFKGREIMHVDLGYTLGKRFLDSIAEYGSAEGDIAQANRSLVVMINHK